MNRNRLLVVAAMLCFAALLPAGAYAQTTANLAISASVAANCTISTTAVAFGAYDPLVTNASAPKDANGGVTVTCTKGSVPTVALGLGSNPSGSVRQMSAGGGNFLTYELYSASDYSTVWGTGTSAYTASAALNKNPRTFTVYGRVPGGQDAATGAYADTVLATVNF
jgi:spore coat protein U-like protein